MEVRAVASARMVTAEAASGAAVDIGGRKGFSAALGAGAVAAMTLTKI